MTENFVYAVVCMFVYTLLAELTGHGPNMLGFYISGLLGFFLVSPIVHMVVG